MTLYALFSDEAELDTAVSKLNSEAVDAQISVIRDGTQLEKDVKVMALPGSQVSGAGAGVPVGSNVKKHFTNMFLDGGLDDKSADFLARQVNQGGVVLTIESDEPNLVENLLTAQKSKVWRTPS